MEIVLLRHGKPNVELKGYLSTKELKNLVSACEQSSIQDVPTEKLKTIFNDHYVICSDLPRSVDSAKKLNLKNIHVSNSLYRETDLPHFDKLYLKLPVMLWLIFLRMIWVFGFSKNAESFKQAKKRSKLAADEIIKLTRKNKKVIIVGHGLINHLIGKELQKRKWQVTERVGKRYWAFSSYTIKPLT